MTILENLPCSTGRTSGTSPSSPGPTAKDSDQRLPL